MLTDNEGVICGGKVVQFDGDMGQVLPVIDGLPPRDVVPFAITSWRHWSSLQKYTLSTNVRALEDPDFAAWLTAVRDGTANHRGTDDIIIPSDMLLMPAWKAGAKPIDREIQLINQTIDKVRKKVT